MAARYSSVTLPLSAKGGAPIISNSSSNHPAPTPTVNLPPESSSMVERILAEWTAPRWGTTMMELKSVMLVVTAARYAITVNNSRASPDVAPGKLPELLYGYTELIFVGTTI
jgi:hypothetical protein